jgi:hypothetical protein
MNCKPIPLAAAILCLALGADLAAQPAASPPAAAPSGSAPPAGGAAPAALPCNITIGWWEGSDLKPLFPFGGNQQPPPRPNDCDFQAWSWTAFASWIQSDPATGQPRFLGLPTPDDLDVNGGQARPEAMAVRQRTLRLSPRDPKPQSMSSVAQATGNPLIDQTGRAVYYAVHMEATYFATTQQYYGPTNYQNATPTTTYPVGATVLKSAWRIVQPNDIAVKAYITPATIDLLESDGQGGLKPNGQTANVTVALVGLHVVGVVQDHPEFLWATFEQVENAPDLPPNAQPNTPVSQQNFTFYKAGTPVSQSNQANSQQNPLSINPTTQAVTPITNVFRQFTYGNAAQNRAADIAAINKNSQEQIGSGSVKTVPQVFANYRLVGTLWMQPNSLQPGVGNLQPQGVGSVSLANSVLETFAQGATVSCFSCHTTGAVSSNYPGKDVNLSHTLLGGLFGVNSLKRQAR